MGMSYKESSEKYKQKKQDHTFFNEKEISKKSKIKKKKNKRANHKHKYIPCIYNFSYKHNNKIEKYQTCGEHCEICGRVKSMYFLWFNAQNKIEQFKEENPNYVEITLPENWDYFKDKYIPIILEK